MWRQARCRKVSRNLLPEPAKGGEHFKRRIWSEPCDQVRASRPGFGLVAAGEHGSVIGIIDGTVEDDTVAVHPDHQNQGLGRALLAGARACVRALGVPILDAWTRDDPVALVSGYGLHREPALRPPSLGRAVPSESCCRCCRARF
ncbi:GNAT family N-acetyltransferase [Streptomyces sp. CB01635]|uniref:GNAT family N-acetyltransferase n=1 Tax=unclassified Streptomyces TaxID=2593676 RepID=UPI001F3AB196|nr:GNAT family N-acetyltransferase [Streptomyces sp. CB01635]